MNHVYKHRRTGKVVQRFAWNALCENAILSARQLAVNGRQTETYACLRLHPGLQYHADAAKEMLTVKVLKGSVEVRVQGFQHIYHEGDTFKVTHAWKKARIESIGGLPAVMQWHNVAYMVQFHDAHDSLIHMNWDERQN